MHKPLVSKIRVHNPNKSKSKVCNRNYVIYIGTREGVDLTNVDYMREEQNLENLFDNKSTEESANDLYVKYISERPNSNGLFGNIDCSDIQRVGNELAALTKQGRNIYRGIVSLSGEDAIELGYTEKEKWVQFIRATIPDVAEQFQIPISELQWCAAVHMEKTHPHCHYMFWSCKDRVSSPYIHPSTQDKCRELLSKEMFKAEREQEVINKTFL